jgi:hypothetical protein
VVRYGASVTDWTHLRGDWCPVHGEPSGGNVSDPMCRSCGEPVFAALAEISDDEARHGEGRSDSPHGRLDPVSSEDSSRSATGTENVAAIGAITFGVSFVVLLPVGWLLGFFLFLSCGSTVNVACEESAGLAWRIWLMLTVGSFVAGGILTYLRRALAWVWILIPIPVGLLGAIVTYVVWDAMR